MSDPYRILGISPDATDRQIRLAWKTLKRTYRPMPFHSKDLRGFSKERYRQLRDTYRQLQGARREKTTDSAGTEERVPLFTEPFLLENARELIQKERFGEAEQLLVRAGPSLRNAEWHYLMGLALKSRFYYLDAQRMFELACRVDPQNEEYLAAKVALAEEAKGFGKGYRTSLATSDGVCVEGLCECCGTITCEGLCEGLCEGICEGLG